MSKIFYVTTAIDYLNGEPHLGHAYEKIITDGIARAHQSLGEKVFFLTGLDEHGLKVQQAAQAKGMESQAYCDELSESWKAFAGALQLTNNDFIRTTEPRHYAVVKAILQKLYDQGDFYKSSYKGFYSTRAETFLTEDDRLPDGSFEAIYGDVIELEEDNYYFTLSKHQQWLIEHIEANPDFIQPITRRNEILGFLKNHELKDLCISRPANRLQWGIPLPFDPDYVTYVWFDALINYVSATLSHGDPLVQRVLNVQPPEEDAETAAQKLELWPADIHVIGKDIVRFHSVYWPIMLKAMGLPLPKQILAHGWWQKDGDKMSKTTGNIVDPVGVINEWGVDAFRFYVTRELSIGPDGNWTDEGFRARYDAELANGLGNLVNRSLSMLKRYRQSQTPAVNGELESLASETIAQVQEAYRANQLQKSLQLSWVFITRINQYIDETAPFKIAKDPEQAGRLGEILYNLVESCRILAVLIWPIIPGTAEKIFDQLQIVDSSPACLADLKWGGVAAGHVTGTPSPLFPRKEPV